MRSDLSIDGKCELIVRLAPAEPSDFHCTRLWRHYHTLCYVAHQDGLVRNS